MTALPKTIQIFLPDGDPRSVRIAEITSRTVQAVQVPRGVIERAADRDELRQVGVYFLFGEADEGGVPQVYIGEAEDCWVRLGQHHKDASKDYWTQAVVVTSKTQKFDKGQGRWLEWYCTRAAAGAQRYRVENQCAAKEPHLTEPVKADLHDHFDTLQILVATLGFPLFQRAAQPLPPPPPVPEETDPVDDPPAGSGDLPPVLSDGETFVYRHREANAVGRVRAGRVRRPGRLHDSADDLQGSCRDHRRAGSRAPGRERRSRRARRGAPVRPRLRLPDAERSRQRRLGPEHERWLAWSSTADGRTLDEIRKATP